MHYWLYRPGRKVTESNVKNNYKKQVIIISSQLTQDSHFQLMS